MLYAQLSDRMKTSIRTTSAIVSGKKRAFFTMPHNIQAIKKLFNVRDDEEIIPAGSPDSIQILIDAMKRAAGETIFFIVIPKFRFDVLTKAGFAFGKNFVNGMEYLSELNKLPVINSNQLIKAM